MLKIKNIHCATQKGLYNIIVSDDEDEDVFILDPITSIVEEDTEECELNKIIEEEGIQKDPDKKEEKS